MQLPEHLWTDYDNAQADDVLAYYAYAIDEKEREGMPLTGPSIDRRMFQMLSRLADSTSIQALACFACAQWRTSVRA